MSQVRKVEKKKITVLRPLAQIPAIPSNQGSKLRVAAYCRVSTKNDEQLISYYAQIRHYEEYIRAKPDYEFAGIFADEGISGTQTEKREAFHSLMKEARDGRIDMIITKSLSRFGRNTLDCLKNIRELKELGINIFFEKENIHTLNSEGEMLLTLIAAIAQNESFNQSENVKWGIHRQYERGQVKSVPSGKFLGYKKDKQGNLIIDEFQASIVRRIYQSFLNGLGTFQIAKVLTEEGIPMAYGGKEWCASHIYKVLTNEKYQGDTLFQKAFNVDYLTKRRAKNKGELPKYYVKDTHPAIIDRETWSLVQLEIARQMQFVKTHSMNKYHTYNQDYPLYGKIFCQSCGYSLLLRQSFRQLDYGQKYWACKRYRDCPYGPKGTNTCKRTLRIYTESIETVLAKAWNQLVNEFVLNGNALPFPNSDNGSLASYRQKELASLILEFGPLESLPYPLLARVLSHIEVGSDNRFTVVFLSGMKYAFTEVAEKDGFEINHHPYDLSFFTYRCPRS